MATYAEVATTARRRVEARTDLVFCNGRRAMSASSAKAPFEKIPQEVLTEIAFASERVENGRKPEYILNAEDIGNLRLVNRRTSRHVQHAFGVRFIRHRKHMVSKNSLEGLSEIAAHPVFSAYVREVSIGPERIPTSVDSIEPCIIGFIPQEDPPVTFGVNENVQECGCTIEEILSGADIMYAYQELELHVLCHQQEVFERRGEAVTLLGGALGQFSKLQKVCLPSYPRDIGYEWAAPWGLRDLAKRISSALRAPPEYSMKLKKTFFEGESYSNWHLETILQALYTMKDQPEWTLDFDLNSSEQYIFSPRGCVSPGPVFDVNCALWKASQDRVKKLSIYRTITMRSGGRSVLGFQRADWLTELFQSCGKNVESLHCRATTYWAKICSQTPLPKLRRLDVGNTWFQECYFRKVLIAHSQTLETIKLNSVSLSIVDWDHSTPGALMQHTRADGTVRDPCWREMLGLMLQMPRLRVIDFAELSWTGSIPDRLSSYQRGKGAQKAYAGDPAAVKETLEHAIRTNAIESRVYGWEVAERAGFQIPGVMLLFAITER